MTTKDPVIVAIRAAYNARKQLSTILEWISGPDWAPYTVAEWAAIWRGSPRGTVKNRPYATGKASYGCDSGQASGEISNAF